MFRVRVLMSIGVLAGLAAGQERVATNATAVLGVSDRSVWFAKAGSIWVTDGVGMPLDTGVAVAQHGVRGSELFVYPGDRVQTIDAEGNVTTRVTPVQYEGGDLGSGCRVWRRILSTQQAEVIELYEWIGGGWVRHVSGVSDPSAYPQIEAIEVRHDRYLVLWSNAGMTSTVDLFDGSWHMGTGTGVCSQTWDWSRGILTCAEGGTGPSDAFAWFEDFGPEGDTPTPSSWGWGGYQFGFREEAPGRPWVESQLVPEFIPFLLGDTTYPLPGDTTHALFWVAGGAVFVAEATTLGVRQIVSGPGTTWAPVPVLAALDTLSLVGEFGGRAVLGVRDPATGYRAVAFDPLLGTADTLVDGLADAPGAGVAFAGGFLFAVDGGVHGRELWFSRGTASTTWMVADLHLGSAGADPRDLHTFGGHAAFLADDGTGTHLFVLDETELDWRRSPVDGRYCRVTELGTWFDVEREARRLGGTLATVRSQEAQDWLWATFGSQDLWIGLEDLDRDGVFEWVSGEPVTFTAWCPGEPGTTPPDEDVVHMADYPGFCDGGWNDQQATDRYRGIVERSARPVAIEEFGSGCEGWPPYLCASFGSATLTHESGWPAAGSAVTFALDVRQDQARPVTGLMVLGFDNTAWAGTPLPLDLHPFGWAPSCVLQVAVVDLVPVALDAYGRGTWTARIPASSSLSGSALFLQGLAVIGFDDCSEATNGVRMVLLP